MQQIYQKYIKTAKQTNGKAIKCYIRETLNLSECNINLIETLSKWQLLTTLYFGTPYRINWRNAPSERFIIFLSISLESFMRLVMAKDWVMAAVQGKCATDYG